MFACYDDCSDQPFVVKFRKCIEAPPLSLQNFLKVKAFITDMFQAYTYTEGFKKKDRTVEQITRDCWLHFLGEAYQHASLNPVLPHESGSVNNYTL